MENSLEMPILHSTENGVILPVKVIPKTSREAVVGTVGGVLKVSLIAPPEKGKANKALIKFLAQSFKLKKQYISIIKGQSSHEKSILIEGCSSEVIFKKIHEILERKEHANHKEKN